MNRLIFEKMFFSAVQFQTGLFAGEIEKKILTKVFSAVSTEKGFRIYAFAILDNSFFMLSALENGTALSVREDMAAVLKAYLDSIAAGDDLRRKLKGAGETWVSVTPVKGRSDELEVIRYIHLLPASRNYAFSAFDYWWTSLSSYRGRSTWDFVDVCSVLWKIDPDDGQHAKNLFVRQHRRAERAGNPVPECLRVRMA